MPHLLTRKLAESTHNECQKKRNYLALFRAKSFCPFFSESNLSFVVNVLFNKKDKNTPFY